ncbi:Multifunctional CCA protein [compost metagenome]
METYLVGGFVRDTLLGLSPNDRDYVVIGESPESMLAKGFTQVGGHFPVFLHPETKEEYALARQEVSTGDGYGDFTYDWDGVTLEEDLSRRDLTINAMAIDTNGKVVDLFGGVTDLNAKLLRHTSPAFSEDPLRVMRVARLSAVLGFSIATETMTLMKEMVRNGMLQALPGERIWKETEKALLSKEPNRYFATLKECGALTVWFPELDAMESIPQRADYHAEGNVWIHTLMVLEEAASLTEGFEHNRQLRIRFAALTHDLGKTVTPHELLWDDGGGIIGKHFGHEDPARYGPLLKEMTRRLTIPTYLRQFSDTVALVHQNVHGIRTLTPKTLVKIFEQIGGVRAINHDSHHLEDIYLACLADNLGRLVTRSDGTVEKLLDYPQGWYFKEAMAAILSVDVGAIMRKLMADGLPVEEALNRVRGDRRRVAKSFKSNYIKQSDQLGDVK